MRVSEMWDAVSSVMSACRKRAVWWAALAASMLLLCQFSAEAPASAFDSRAENSRVRDSQQTPMNQPPAFGTVVDNALYISRPLQRIGSDLQDYTVGSVPVVDPDDQISTLLFEVSVVTDPGEGTDAVFTVESSRSTAEGVVIELVSGSVPHEFGQYGSGQYELEVTVSDGKDSSGQDRIAMAFSSLIKGGKEITQQPYPTPTPVLARAVSAPLHLSSQAALHCCLRPQQRPQRWPRQRRRLARHQPPRRQARQPL